MLRALLKGPFKIGPLLISSLPGGPLLIGLLAAVPALPAPAKVHHPLRIGALQEFGMVQRGVIGGNVLEDVKAEWIDHFGVSLTQTITWDGRFQVSGGLGGIFQFRKPEVVNGGFPGSQRKAFFIGPSVAEAAYLFGNPEAPRFRLGLGMFPYKYNAEAVNLGEYLFRSVPYPSVVMTGGYALVGGAAAYMQGVKGEWRGGNLRLDLMLTTETALAPLYDGSLAAVGAWTLGDGLLELGAGVNFKRLLQVYPERTARRNKANGYFFRDGKPESANFNLHANRRTFWQTRLESAANAADSARFAALVAHNDSLADFVEGMDQMPASARPALQYYSAAGTLVMARATLDLKKALPFLASAVAGREGLKVFAEAALLGWKDYPVFYEDKRKRLPVMAGVNLPTFGLLDLLCLQAEYFDSPYLNNTWPIGSDGNNIPFVPEPSDGIVSRREYYDVAGADNLKWSALLRKQVHANVAFSAQVASDHLRIADASSYYGPQLNPNEVTLRKSDWYWMLQLAWGI